MKWIFWIAATLVAYTYLGYPCWLRMRLLWRPRPILRGSNQPLLSIVMVVRNEEKTVATKVQNLLGLEYPEDRREIVVVSDGSTDQTDEILQKYVQQANIQAISNPQPRGKASGLNDAIARTRGEIVVFTDARQQIEPWAIRLLTENFADPSVGCVSGELMLGDPNHGESARGMGLYWRIEKGVRELESASGSVVGATGALYAVRRELLPTVPAGTILDDVFMPMQVIRQGKRVVFDDRARAWDLPDLGRQREFARKVRTLSGVYQLLQLEPWLLSNRNPLRFEFVSHKLLRLAVPFALGLLLVTCAGLAGGFYRAVLVLQLVFYLFAALALAGLMPKGVLWRVAEASATFVLLNGAALMALANVVTGRRPAWTR